MYTTSCKRVMCSDRRIDSDPPSPLNSYLPLTAPRYPTIIPLYMYPHHSPLTTNIIHHPQATPHVPTHIQITKASSKTNPVSMTYNPKKNHSPSPRNPKHTFDRKHFRALPTPHPFPPFRSAFRNSDP